MSDEENISMTIEKKMDIDTTHFIYQQISDRSKKVLDYDYKKCNGCGICIDVCPTKALELGPMKEIATGLDVPPVILDLEKCTFCGMCAQFCPFHAYYMTEEGTFPSQADYPKYDDFVRPNDKCIPCKLCEATCPEDAIKVEFYMPHKNELSPFKENEQGTIEIDNEKCNLCGICAVFCDAFLLIDKEKTPINVTPFEQLLVDEEKCDYCTLCQEICPEDAIKVIGNKQGEAPSVNGKLFIDDLKCTRCTWCQIVCPYEAMDIKKPFEGKIELIDANISKCDPQGCHGCFNVCPSHLWYVAKDGKISMQESMCTYCGACVNACPQNVMTVARNKIHYKNLSETPWKKQWKDALDSIVTGKRNVPDISRTLEVIDKESVSSDMIEFPHTDPNLLEMAQKKITKVTHALNNISIRRMMEQTNEQELVQKNIVTHIKKQTKM